MRKKQHTNETVIDLDFAVRQSNLIKQAMDIYIVYYDAMNVNLPTFFSINVDFKVQNLLS